MKELRYTLLSEGSSDAVLLPILTWLLEDILSLDIQPSFADLRGLQQVPRELHRKIIKSVELYPCDLLFIHRDSEGLPREIRIIELQQAIHQATHQGYTIPTTSVITVRMQEAWLLFDELAIRKAAGNPRGRVQLNLPNIARFETLPDPKQILHDALRTASELHGRRRHQFNPERQALLITRNITDFSPLRQLSAFQALESDLRELITAQGWNNPD